VLAVSAAASADDSTPTKEYRIFGQLTTLLELNENEERGDYTKFKQLASFNIEWKRLTIGARGDYVYYSDPDIVEPQDPDRLYRGFHLRRYFIDYQSDKFSGRAGTFFSSFGRGLTLYVQRNETLQLDEPIHGAVTRLTLKNLDITVLGGEVTEPIQQLQYNQVFEDIVYGGRVLGRLPLGLYLGGSAVRAELERPFPVTVDGRLITDDIVEVWAIEGGATGLWGVLDLAGEFSELEREEPNRTVEGHGRYLSASLYVGPLSVLAEYKDYYNFAYRYNLPPNAGRADESYEHNDVKGPRLLVSTDVWSIGSLFHASYAEFDSHTSRGSFSDRQREWYAGIEQTIGRVYFEGSYFDRRYIDREIDETHTIGDLHVTVGRRGEIILGYDQRLEESAYARLDTTRTNLTYSLSPWGTASLRYAYEDKSRSGKEDFWGIELQYLPTPKIVLTVFGGGDPGGLVCAGGQCRVEPRFEGYRANFTWRF
jgi:hypothetical protein